MLFTQEPLHIPKELLFEVFDYIGDYNIEIMDNDDKLAKLIDEYYRIKLNMFCKVPTYHMRHAYSKITRNAEIKLTKAVSYRDINTTKKLLDSFSFKLNKKYCFSSIRITDNYLLEEVLWTIFHQKSYIELCSKLFDLFIERGSVCIRKNMKKKMISLSQLYVSYKMSEEEAYHVHPASKYIDSILEKYKNVICYVDE